MISWLTRLIQPTPKTVRLISGDYVVIQFKKKIYDLCNRYVHQRSDLKNVTGSPLAEVVRQIGVSASAISKAITRETKE